MPDSPAIPDFYELSPADLEQWFTQHKQPAYRARQVLEWAYRKAAPSFDAMTNLPVELRHWLEKAFAFGPLPVLHRHQSADTTKLLVQLPRGGEVECVRIAMGEEAATACVSSQVGCAVECAFCATGQKGVERSLGWSEIIRQVITLNILEGAVRNVVFMGMGEPFLNYANTVNAVKAFTNRDTFALSPRRITISTSGVVPAIFRYAEEGLATELAVSLNASTDEQRQRLMPGVSRWPIEALLKACSFFSEKWNGRPVTFAYVLLEGVNDHFDDARRLGKLLRPQPHHLNVIPFNPVADSEFIAPHPTRVRAFMDGCRRQGLNVSLRRSKGDDIEAACGQLRGRHTPGHDE